MQEDWTEKYRPKSLSQIIGNESAANAMKRWGESWKSGVPRTKALTLQGEPGTGKTSAALALASDMGWDAIEMNASDHRNAASIKKVAGLGSAGQTFSPTGEFLSSNQGHRKLVILDEADNLFGREDYGGAKAIVETIRESGQPIILIVNDYYELTRRSSAIKSLSEKITFRSLDQRSVVKALAAIAHREQVTISEAILDLIAKNSGGDLRAAVNDLQMMVEGKKVIEAEDALAMGKRNQKKELNESLRAMFGALSLREARDATLDLDETPDDLEKWIEEAIPPEMPHPDDLAEAFDALSRSDIYLGRTRKHQYYGFWSYAKELMTGGVALSRKHGQRPNVYDYRFPGFFILLSRSKGPRAARESITSKMVEFLHTSKREMNESMLPYLSILAKNDSQLLVRLSRDLALDEGDIAFLLGEEPDSARVQMVVSQVKGEESSKPEAKADARPSRRRGGLADF
jgi:replication factor C large subunit